MCVQLYSHPGIIVTLPHAARTDLHTSSCLRGDQQPAMLSATASKSFVARCCLVFRYCCCLSFGKAIKTKLFKRNMTTVILCYVM